MLERLPPIGFWSYARQDDDASQGQLSALRLQVKAELQQQYGHDPITIFQDVAAILPGAEWEREIRNAIGNATFLIPIITPAFIESEWCSKEVSIFLEREQQIWREFPGLAGKRRIFPIHYRAIEEVRAFDEAVLLELRKLQWTDYRELRYKNPREEVVQKTLDVLGRSMSTLLHIRVEPAGSGDAPPLETPPGDGSQQPPVRTDTPKAPPDRAAGAAASGGAVDPPLQDAGGAQTGGPAHAGKTFAIDTGGASPAGVVWSIARQLIAVGMVIWAIVIGLHIPGQLSSGGPQAAGGLVIFIITLLGGAGILWRAGR